jgi:DNA-directed RNA polymerase subunit beta'
VLVCEAVKGLCQKCYGRDLSTKKLINIGEAVGIISAQSIGEPGTQLTMRTFHTGGADLSKASKIEIKVNFEGTLKFPDNMYTKKITDEFGARVEIVTRDTQILLERGSNNVTTYPIPAGAVLIAKNGQKVKAGTSIAEHDPKFEFVISSFNGLIKFIGLDVKEHKDKEGNVTERIAQQDGEIFVFNKEEAKEYKIPEDAEILVEEGVRVKGDSLPYACPGSAAKV